MFTLLLALLLVASASGGKVHKACEDYIPSTCFVPATKCSDLALFCDSKWSANPECASTPGLIKDNCQATCGTCAEEKLMNETDRFWGTKENPKQLLEGINLWDKVMKRDDSVNWIWHRIEWTQFSRCWWECREEFFEMSFKENGNGAEYKVFIAKVWGDWFPNEFNTKGLWNMLNAGFYNDKIDGKRWDVVVFVIMPSDWKIYQHRFYTSTLKAFIDKVAKKMMTKGAPIIAAKAIAAGATIGSIIPGPGTAVGAAIGAAAGGAALVTAGITWAFAENYDDFFGSFLTHIG